MKYKGNRFVTGNTRSAEYLAFHSIPRPTSSDWTEILYGIVGLSKAKRLDPSLPFRQTGIRAEISQIVLNLPGLAAVLRALTELPNFVWALIEELQMPTQFCAVRLRHVVGPVVHHAIF